MGRLWYIRHGQTDFNLRSQLWHQRGDIPEESDYQYTPEHIDPPLNSEGIRQILANKERILQLEIDIIYVSPMLRTLESCWYLFGDIANRPKIIVNPIFTEWIHVNHDAPLYPNNYSTRFKEYDWSMMPEGVFIHQILKNKFTEMIDEHTDSVKIVELMKNIRPESIESRNELYNRANIAKEFLRKETIEKNVAVVGHSAFYRHFTSELESDGTFTGQKLLHNGEFAEIAL